MYNVLWLHLTLFTDFLHWTWTRHRPSTDGLLISSLRLWSHLLEYPGKDHPQMLLLYRHLFSMYSLLWVHVWYMQNLTLVAILYHYPVSGQFSIEVFVHCSPHFSAHQNSNVVICPLMVFRTPACMYAMYYDWAVRYTTELHVIRSVVECPCYYACL